MTQYEGVGLGCQKQRPGMLDPLLDEDYCNQANGNRQRQHGEKKYVQQSKTVTMAEDLKYKSSLQKKAKLGDDGNIAAEDR